MAAGTDTGADETGGGGVRGAADVAARDNAEAEMLATRSLPHARSTRRQSFARRSRETRRRGPRRLRDDRGRRSARVFAEAQSDLRGQRNGRQTDHPAGTAGSIIRAANVHYG